MSNHEVDVSGIGGTLSGSALAMAAVRATLTNSLLQPQFDKSIVLASRWAEGVKKSYLKYGLNWSVQQLGCRAEYCFAELPRTGAQAADASDPQLESFLHIWAINRGVLLTPFHNMALISPFHSAQEVDLHTQIFDQALSALSN